MPNIPQAWNRSNVGDYEAYRTQNPFDVIVGWFQIFMKLRVQIFLRIAAHGCARDV